MKMNDNRDFYFILKIEIHLVVEWSILNNSYVNINLNEYYYNNIK